MNHTTIDINRAVEYILSPAIPAEVKQKKPRGRHKKEVPPIWALEFFNPEKNRTFALISMCIKDDYNQSIEELAGRLSELKARPPHECLSVLRKLSQKGKLGYYDSNMVFRLWTETEAYNGLESFGC